MKHKASLQTLVAMVASLAAMMRENLFNSESSPSNPSRARFGKSAGGSGELRKSGHPLFQRRRIKNAQPEGYYTQGIDRRHIHSYGPWQSPEILKIKGDLKRPQFA
jgi:hypothetical protein